MDYNAPVDEGKVEEKLAEKAPKEEPKVESKEPKVTSWLDSVPEDYREHLKDVKDVGSLAKQYVDQQAFLGNSIRIPGEDAGDESKKEFMDKLLKHAPGLMYRPDPSDEQAMKDFWATAGVPDSPDKYDLGELPEGVSEDFVAQSKELGHKYGLTSQGLKAYVEDQVALQTAQNEAMTEAQTEDLKALSQEWGQATESKLEDISRFAQEMDFPDTFKEALSQNAVGSDWLKAMDKVIQQFGGLKEDQEGSFQKGKNQIDTPAEVMQKIAEIEANPAFRKTGDPRYKGLVEKRMELLKKLNG